MKTRTSGQLDNFSTQVKGRSRPASVWLLLILQIFLAMGALLGGGAFILAPDGSLIQMPFSHLKNSPFSSFLIPGVLLFVLLGIYPLMVAYSLWKKPDWQWPAVINPFKHTHWSWAASLAVGVIVIIWITAQVIWVPFGIVHMVYLAYGVVLLGVTLLPGTRQYYSHGLR